MISSVSRTDLLTQDLREPYILQVLHKLNLKKGETTMYSVSDVVELGEAHELVLSDIKEVLRLDDAEEQSMQPGEYFDE